MKRVLLCVLAAVCLAGAAPKKPKLVLAIVVDRSEEHTSELQSLMHLVCRLLLEKKIKFRLGGLGTVTGSRRILIFCGTSDIHTPYQDWKNPVHKKWKIMSIYS